MNKKGMGMMEIMAITIGIILLIILLYMTGGKQLMQAISGLF